MKTLLLLCVAFLLVSCTGGVHETVYEYTPPTASAGKACIDRCIDARRSCELVCADKEACEVKSRERAHYEYEDYVMHRRTTGQPVTRTSNTFYNPRLCADVPGCDCEQEYNACYELCGGQVQAERIRVK